MSWSSLVNYIVAAFNLFISIQVFAGYVTSVSCNGNANKGEQGDTCKIQGEGLLGIEFITVGGQDAFFTVVNADLVTFKVPPYALRTEGIRIGFRADNPIEWKSFVVSSAPKIESVKITKDSLALDTFLLEVSWSEVTLSVPVMFIGSRAIHWSEFLALGDSSASIKIAGVDSSISMQRFTISSYWGSDSQFLQVPRFKTSILELPMYGGNPISANDPCLFGEIVSDVIKMENDDMISEDSFRMPIYENGLSTTAFLTVERLPGTFFIREHRFKYHAHFGSGLDPNANLVAVYDAPDGSWKIKITLRPKILNGGISITNISPKVISKPGILEIQGDFSNCKIASVVLPSLASSVYASGGGIKFTPVQTSNNSIKIKIDEGMFKEITSGFVAFTIRNSERDFVPDKKNPALNFIPLSRRMEEAQLKNIDKLSESKGWFIVKRDCPAVKIVDYNIDPRPKIVLMGVAPYDEFALTLRGVNSVDMPLVVSADTLDKYFTDSNSAVSWKDERKYQSLSSRVVRLKKSPANGSLVPKIFKREKDSFSYWVVTFE